MTTNCWFTADTHFFHEKVIGFCNRPFASLEEMHETLISNWNNLVARGDVVYHLGDFAFTWKKDPKPVEDLLKRLHGSKHLICGNHDRDPVKSAAGWANVCDYKRIEWAKQKIALFHYAMRVWHGNQRGSWHLYGHSHGSLPEDHNAKSLDVGVDVWDFRPVSFDQVAERMKSKTFVPVDHHGVVAACDLE